MIRTHSPAADHKELWQPAWGVRTGESHLGINHSRLELNQVILDAFINRFILCGSCKNPETDLIITANVCNGKECGERMGVNMRHRVIARAVQY
jgi:hypothetical protein